MRNGCVVFGTSKRVTKPTHRNDMNTRFFSFSLVAACLYLYLPFALFLGCRVQFYWAYPLIIILSAAVGRISRDSLQRMCRQEAGRAPITPREWCTLALSLLLTLGWVEMLGIHGHVPQCGDWSVRTPLYEAFCRGEYNLYVSGKYIVYYDVFYLPPAFLTRLSHGLISAETALFLWSYAGLALAEIILFTRLRGKLLLFLGILFVFGAPSSWWSKVIYPFLEQKSAESGWGSLPVWLRVGAPVRSYMQVSSNIISGPNHGIPTVLAMALLLTRPIPRRHRPIVAALLIPCAPLNALAMFPLLVFNLVKDRASFVRSYLGNIPLWGCVLALIPVGTFFLCNTAGGSNHFVFADAISRNYRHFYYLDALYASPFLRTARAGAEFLLLMIPCALLLHRHLRRTTLFAAAVLTAGIMAFYLMGRNELLFKGGMVLFMMLTLLFVSEWKIASFRRKCLLLLFLVPCNTHLIGDPVHRQWWKYGWDEETIQHNIRRGSLEQLNNDFYGENRFPQILLPPEKP